MSDHTMSTSSAAIRRLTRRPARPARRLLVGGAAALAALGGPRRTPAPPAGARPPPPKGTGPSVATAPLGGRHVAQPRRDDRPGHRPPGDNIPASLAPETGRATRPRRTSGVPVVDRRRARAGHHLRGRRARPARAHAHDARGDGAPRAQRDVLQLVRRGHRRPVLIWPENGTTVHPFVSSVDNGWLGAALLVVKNSDAVAGPLAAEIFARMRWDAFYNPGTASAGTRGASRGLMHGGFYVFDHDRPGGRLPGHAHRRGRRLAHDAPLRHDRLRDAHHELPRHPDRPGARPRTTTRRGAPSRRRATGWHEMQPVGETRTYLGSRSTRGLHVPRHAHRARVGRKHVRGAHARRLRAGGGLGARSWASTTRSTSGPSASTACRGGLRLLGLLALEQPGRGLPRVRRRRAGDEPRGYFSDQENTNYDVGFGECRPATNPNPDFKTGVVTPHASFLAMMYERGEATANLLGSRSGSAPTEPAASTTRWPSTARSPGATSRSTRPWSWEASATSSKDLLRRAFSTPDVEAALRPVIGIEEFSAGRGRVGPPSWRRLPPTEPAAAVMRPRGGGRATRVTTSGRHDMEPVRQASPAVSRGRPALGARVGRGPPGGHHGRRCAGIPRHRPDRAGPARGLGLRPRPATVASRPATGRLWPMLGAGSGSAADVHDGDLVVTGGQTAA